MSWMSFHLPLKSPTNVMVTASSPLAPSPVRTLLLGSPGCQFVSDAHIIHQPKTQPRKMHRCGDGRRTVDGAAVGPAEPALADTQVGAHALVVFVVGQPNPARVGKAAMVHHIPGVRQLKRLAEVLEHRLLVLAVHRGQVAVAVRKQLALDL